MVDVCIVLCLLSTGLSTCKAFDLRIAGISRKLESEREKYALRQHAAHLNS